MEPTSPFTPQTAPATVSFWAETHPLSALCDTLHEQLVPARGPAATAHGQLLASFSNLYYDVHNNGASPAANCPDVAVVEQHREELLDLLEDKSSWSRTLRTILKEAAKDFDNVKPAIGQLEDIGAAVVKLVAAKAGVPVPDAGQRTAA